MSSPENELQFLLIEKLIHRRTVGCYDFLFIVFWLSFSVQDVRNHSVAVHILFALFQLRPSLRRPEFLRLLAKQQVLSKNCRKELKQAEATKPFVSGKAFNLDSDIVVFTLHSNNIFAKPGFMFTLHADVVHATNLTLSVPVHPAALHSSPSRRRPDPAEASYPHSDGSFPHTCGAPHPVPESS